MEKVNIIIFVFVLLLQGISCQKNNSEHEPETVETLPLDGSLGVDSLYGVPANKCREIFMEDKQWTIKSTNEYDNLISSLNCLTGFDFPNIDFSKYTLLAGLKITPYLPYKVTELEVIKNNDKQQYNYNVKIMNSGYPAFGAFIYWTLIPKIDKNYSVVYNVEVIPFNG